MFFKKNPFVRLLIPFIAGIALQWRFHASLSLLIILLLCPIILFAIFEAVGSFLKLRYGFLQGAVISLAFLFVGMLVTYFKDMRHSKNWIGHEKLENKMLIATLNEPLLSKEKSYKAEANISYMIYKGSQQAVDGTIIIYFKKDSLTSKLKVGDQIILNKPLQEIHNPGNPGAFDYKTYSLFKGIMHQVYLTAADYYPLSTKNLPVAKSLLLKTRDFVLNAIRENVSGKKEQGLAEAMLIGYKDDLDKNLLQSYTNTGVVHVIAVSGMHLALLYWILGFLFQPLLKNRRTRWLHPVLVLLVLWGFSFIAGGAASIVRAAVMFTFITVGKLLNRNASIYNILAAAAFCQLCYNPYWIWDVGFQLSYVAVLSIVIFYKPIYNLLFIKNKILNHVWQLAAVSIAAQILTTPFSMYYFHQFPVYFLISNLVVVPVSTCVLIGTLLLVIFSPIKMISSFIGYVLNGLIWWLNSFIERMEIFPFALLKGIQINALQTALLIIVVAGFSYWLLEKYKNGLWVALSCLLLFFIVRSYSFYNANNQERLIVYNIPRQTVVDFISGRKYISLADSGATENISTQNYVLNPSRTLQRISQADHLSGLYKNNNAVQFNNKKIIFINNSVYHSQAEKPINADVVILCGNPKLYISNLLKSVNAGQIVIDGSTPAWKAKYWMRDCDSFKIPCYNVSTRGAFVMNLH